MAANDDDEPVLLQASNPIIDTPTVERREPAPKNRLLAGLLLVIRVIAGVAIVTTLIAVTFGSLGLRFWGDRIGAPGWSQHQETESSRAEPVVPAALPPSAALPPGSECNQPLVLQRMQALMQTLSFDSSANLGQTFLDTCDRDPQIGFATMESWYRISQFEKSLRVLDRFPDEARYYSDLATWRGFVLEKVARHAEAATAFERALYTFTDLSRVGYPQFHYISRAYRSAHDYCRAMRPLQQFVAIDAPARATPDVMAEIEELKALGACKDGSDQISSVPLKRRNNLLYVQATINQVPALLILDTGASAIHLSKSFATRAGLKLDASWMTQVEGVNGIGNAYVTSASTVSVGVQAARDVVVLVDTDANAIGGADGLLGQTYLSRFKVTVEREALRLDALSK